MIVFRQTNALMLTEEKQIQQLEMVVRHHDKTFRSLFLSNQYNFDGSMPCFFMAYDDEKLVGFGLIYADEQSEAEISLIVHPQYRRRGIAKGILHDIRKVCQNYQINNLVYQTERTFLKQNPIFVDKYSLSFEHLPQYLMEWRENLIRHTVDKELTMVLVNEKNMVVVAKALAEGFDSDYQTEYQFVRNTLALLKMRQFIFLNEKQAVMGTAAIEIGDEVNYLFAFTIFQKYQNKGYAMAAIGQIIQWIRQNNQLPIQLQVEIDHSKAIHVYQKMGFETVSEVVMMIDKL